jgi:hypothetical protein
MTVPTKKGLRQHARRAEIHFERIAVTPAQISAWNLPSRPTKQIEAEKSERKLGWRTHNQLGRVLFQADAFASTNSEKDGLLFDTAYGTRYSYNADGTPSCSIRSKGAPLVSLISTDDANEIYPSCVSHRFASNKEYVTTTDAASLLAGSPQTGVTKESGHRSPAGTQDLPAGCKRHQHHA